MRTGLQQEARRESHLDSRVEGLERNVKQMERLLKKNSGPNKNKKKKGAKSEVAQRKPCDLFWSSYSSSQEESKEESKE